MTTLAALFLMLFALPLAALIAAHTFASLRRGPALPKLDRFQLAGLAVARERMHAMTGRADELIAVRAAARLADELEHRAACDELRAEIARARAPRRDPLMARARTALAWAHATSPALRAVARPVRLARYYARTAVAAAVLATALLGSACGVVRALPTREESRRHTSAVIGGASAAARMVLR